MSFTEKDIQIIEDKGLTLDKVNAQMNTFRSGIPYINLKRAATQEDGIILLDMKEKEHFIELFESRRDSISIVKFVPASGAATRMFKKLFTFLKEYLPSKSSINSYINKNKARELSIFLIGLEKLPFFEEVIHKTHKIVPNFNDLSYDEQRVEFIKTILNNDRLNYSFYPKGLLPFHKYKTHVSTAFEEHLFEAALYASSKNEANLHFTISERYNHKFDEEFKYIEEDVEDKTGTKFNVSFSFQKHSTDTIAVTPKNEPFRDQKGNLVFRPSGHGALLENLNGLDGDIVFVKNIDNVVVNKFKNVVAEYKKMLGGILLERQDQVFKYLNKIETNKLNEGERLEVAQFLSNKMNVYINDEYEKYSPKYQKEYLTNKLTAFSRRSFLLPFNKT